MLGSRHAVMQGWEGSERVWHRDEVLSTVETVVSAGKPAVSSRSLDAAVISSQSFFRRLQRQFNVRPGGLAAAIAADDCLLRTAISVVRPRKSSHVRVSLRWVN